MDNKHTPRFETAEQIQGWKRVVDAVHKEGSAFAPQLWHTGLSSADPIGPSPLQYVYKGNTYLVPGMESFDFDQIREAFVTASINAQKIGCDAIEIHGAHGYLLDSFMSKRTNFRKDNYGGDFQNRIRFPSEIVSAIRKAVGPDYPIIYRFSQWTVSDYNEIKFENSKELQIWATTMKNAGVSIFHVSTRYALAPAFSWEDAHKTLVEWTREFSGLPCIAVGKVAISIEFGGESRDVQVIPVADPTPFLNMIEDNKADMVAIGRSLLSNPDWVKVVRDEDWKKLKPYDKVVLDKRY